MNVRNSLAEKHQKTLEQAVAALKVRTYYSPYPENPKSYPEDADGKARAWISEVMNNDFKGVSASGGNGWHGEEISPFLQVGIGVKYPTIPVNTLIAQATKAGVSWAATSPAERAGILMESLERVSKRFFDVAYATMHTTGQSFLMAFQASGPHANDRALEAIAMGYQELTRFVNETDWVKPMGKFDLKVHKNFKAVPRGINLVIGCSTFPIWNTVPGVYAALIAGNPCIVKPHPKAILPIAIVIEELQKVFAENSLDANLVQLAADSSAQPISKELAEHPAVKMIDFTGSSEFGNYIESLPKITFTEKAGVNSIILDSVSDAKAVFGNIAFSASLYSGQMCTAPQNIFISKDGVKTPDGVLSFDEAAKHLADAVLALVDHPKAGPATLGAIQAEATYKRVQEAKNLGGKVLLDTKAIRNEEFEHARIATPVVMTLDSTQKDVFNKECFGPVLFVIKTNGVEDSIAQTRKLADEKGALTCGAYTTDEKIKQDIEEQMNASFVPVSFNFTGAGFINSHAAFSDFHLTGANPAGNASFTNPEFVSKRFVWVGNRYM